MPKETFASTEFTSEWDPAGDCRLYVGWGQFAEAAVTIAGLWTERRTGLTHSTQIQLNNEDLDRLIKTLKKIQRQRRV